MNRKRFILSIFLMAVLVSVGIVLPAMHLQQFKGRQEKKKETPKTSQATKKAEKTPAKEKPSSVQLQYLGFEDLEAFFTATQTEDLKEQIASYLQEAGYSDISSVTFLVDETTYPSRGEILLSFALSDGSKLPVTCQTASGTFTFGDENLTVHSEHTPATQIYTRQTDDSLPVVTTEEIEAMQEGGYADTKSSTGNNTAGYTADNTGANIGELAENHTRNHTGEVTP